MSRPNKGPRLEQNKSGFFEIRWTENGRSKRVSTGEKNVMQARAFFAEWLGGCEQGGVRTSSATAREVLRFYLNTHVEEQVLAKDRCILSARHLESFFGDSKISEITAEKIAQYKASRKAARGGEKPISDGTIRRELVTFIAAMNHAKRNKKISGADMPSISLPPTPPSKDLWLNESEEAEFWKISSQTSGDRLSREFRFVAIALETAARLNSIVGLRWNQIDLERGIIRFEADGKRQKNKRRVPVPISDRLKPVLERAYSEKISEFVLDCDSDIRRAFDKIVCIAAQVIDNRLSKMTPHTLRHTWATLAARAGVDLYAIAGVLGDTLSTVEKNYLHHAPDHLRGAINFKIQKAA